MLRQTHFFWIPMRLGLLVSDIYMGVLGAAFAPRWLTPPRGGNCTGDLL
jgi:hypothetical protein